MDTDALFKQLEPPPGGAEGFARKLDDLAAQRRSPHRVAVAAAAGIASVALVAALLVLRKPDADAPALVAGTPPVVDVYNAPELDRLLGRSSQPTDLVVMVNTETVAVTEIPTANQKVRIYQIN